MRRRSRQRSWRLRTSTWCVPPRALPNNARRCFPWAMACCRAPPPIWQVPAAVRAVGRLPRAADGSVDEGALPTPAEQRTYVPPADAIEEGVQAVWMGVLGLDAPTQASMPILGCAHHVVVVAGMMMTMMTVLPCGFLIRAWRSHLGDSSHGRRAWTTTSSSAAARHLTRTMPRVASMHRAR